MSYEFIILEYEGDFATITMNNPKRRNALSLKHMLELTSAFQEVGESNALGVILAANGPAFYRDEARRRRRSCCREKRFVARRLGSFRVHSASQR